MTNDSMKPWREAYDGPYIKSDELPEGSKFKVQILSVTPPNTEYDSQKRLIDKAIIRFYNTPKGLIIGKTNYRVLRALHGIDPEKWIDKEVTLQRRYIDAFGEKDVMCIRIMPTEGLMLPKAVRDNIGTAKPKYGGSHG